MTCEFCNSLLADKYIEIDTFPQLLCLQLKRSFSAAVYSPHAVLVGSGVIVPAADISDPSTLHNVVAVPQGEFISNNNGDIARLHKLPTEAVHIYDVLGRGGVVIPTGEFRSFMGQPRIIVPKGYFIPDATFKNGFVQCPFKLRHVVAFHENMDIVFPVSTSAYESIEVRPSEPVSRTF